MFIDVPWIKITQKTFEDPIIIVVIVATNKDPSFVPIIEIKDLWLIVFNAVNCLIVHVNECHHPVIFEYFKIIKDHRFHLQMVLIHQESAQSFEYFQHQIRKKFMRKLP